MRLQPNCTYVTHGYVKKKNTLKLICPLSSLLGLPLFTELSEPTDYRPNFFGLVTDFSQAEIEKTETDKNRKKMLPKPKKPNRPIYRPITEKNYRNYTEPIITEIIEVYADIFSKYIHNFKHINKLCVFLLSIVILLLLFLSV